MNGVGITGGGYTGIGVTGQDVLIYGNLLVSGGIDPTYLALTPTPFGPQGFINPLWVDNQNGNALRSEYIYLDKEPNTAYISLVPDNNQAQIILSDGSLNDMRISMTYEKIEIENNSAAPTLITNIQPSNITLTDTNNATISQVKGSELNVKDAGQNRSNIIQSNNTVITDGIYSSTQTSQGISASFNDGTGNGGFVSLNSVSGLTIDNFNTGNDSRAELTTASGKTQLKCYNFNTSALLDYDILASNLLLNGVSISNPTLSQVLTASDNANSLSISNLSNLGVSTINGSAYPPSVATPSWNDTLNVSSSASQSISLNNNDINSVNNLQVNTINGGSITTIGLLWSDFSNTNAYNNLPNQAYALQNTSGTIIQSQHLYDRFQIDDTGGFPTNMTLNSNSLSFTDNTSSTTTSYSTNNISSQNGTAFTITAGSGGSGLQSLNLNCSALVINGTTFSPTTPKLSQITSSTTSWSISAGSFNNVATGTFSFASGWSGNKEFQLLVSFNNYNSTENTGVMYIEFLDSMFNPSNPYCFNSTTPCFNTHGNSFTGNYTLFSIADRIQLNNTTASPTFNFVIYLGHNGGTWTGNAKYTFILTEI